MKDVRTGKYLMFVPQLPWAGGSDDVDPAFINAITSNGGANNITVVRMCAPPIRMIHFKCMCFSS